MLNNQKKCSKCGEIKELSEFHKQSSVKSGHRSSCKVCRTIEKKEYRAKNIDKIKASNKEYRLNHLEQEKAKKKRFKINNPNYHKDYYEKNKEKVAIVSKKRYEEKKDEINKKHKEYYQRNKEDIKKYITNWQRTPKGIISKRNTSNKRRYVKLNTSDGKIPIDNIYPLTIELINLLELQNYKCNSCGCDISKYKELDHHIPLSKGGNHSIDNVVWLCPNCNRSKSAKVPKEPLQIVVNN